MNSKKPEAIRKHRVIIDFRDSEVAKKSDRPIWEGFRIWESVKWPIPRWTDFKKYRRLVNTIGTPPFDIFSDYLMDFATIAAAAMKQTAWKNFRRLVLLHVPTCPSTCWYCFNDAWGKTGGNCVIGEKTAPELIDYFRDQQERDEKIEGYQCNILRLSGGEPFDQPELVEDLANAISDQKDLSLFFWVDTNLIPLIKQRNRNKIKNSLDALRKFRAPDLA